MFAEKAKAIEDIYTARADMVESELGREVEQIGDVLNNPVENKREYRFYATGTVIAATAFVEACINELIHKGTSAGSRPPRLQMDNAALLENIHDYTDINLFQYGTLNKYKLVLAIADKDLDTDGQVYENITLVLNLRNKLIHHRPEFEKLSADVSDQRFGQLQHKFDASPFYGGLYFPYRCMSFDCAKWAIESCLGFTEYFYSQLDEDTPYRIPNAEFTIKVS